MVLVRWIGLTLRKVPGRQAALHQTEFLFDQHFQIQIAMSLLVAALTRWIKILIRNGSGKRPVVEQVIQIANSMSFGHHASVTVSGGTHHDLGFGYPRLILRRLKAKG
jgi:hypothetical protein